MGEGKDYRVVIVQSARYRGLRVKGLGIYGATPTGMTTVIGGSLARGVIDLQPLTFIIFLLWEVDAGRINGTEAIH